MLGGIIGSILPDCDHKKATAGFVPLWLFVNHREQTHSLFFSVFASMLFGVLNLWLGVGVLGGMLLHLAGDRTTAMGQIEGLRYLYWPFKNEYKETQYKKAA